MAKEIKLSKKKVNQGFEKFQESIQNFNALQLEIEPKTPSQIYRYYQYIDKLYIWIKKAYCNDLSVLNNEMRAILGHLSEYNALHDAPTQNLTKAYGHLRRLSIDTLKITCNGLDLFFQEWINKYSHYDFRDTDGQYMPRYMKLYYSAHRQYMKVQKIESNGSDRQHHIIKEYYEVVKLYQILYQYHLNARRRKIERRVRLIQISQFFCIGGISFLAILSIAGILLQPYIYYSKTLIATCRP